MAPANRDAFLADQAEEMAILMKTDQEKALKAICHAEASKKTYKNIGGITGHRTDRNPLTKVDILMPHDSNTYVMLTDKDSIETAIMRRNQHHARQSLQTPFASNQTLAQAINPCFPGNQINQILDETFLANDEYINNLNNIEQEWVTELSRRIEENISTQINLEDSYLSLKGEKKKLHHHLLGDTWVTTK